MNLSLNIARRYFFSKKKKSFINIISIVAMLGIMIGTMALVVVMSVFNGMADLQRQLFQNFDADLRVTPVQGKTFILETAQKQKIKQLSEIQSFTETIEENALLRYGKAQVVAKVKGIDPQFLKKTQLKNALVEGELLLQDGPRMYAVLGAGVHQILGATIGQGFYSPIECWYPRDAEAERIDLQSTDAFQRLDILPSGVFSIEQGYDYQYVIVPIDFAKALFGYVRECSAIELQLKNQSQKASAKKAVQAILGPAFEVKNREEQHATMFKAIRFEKLFVFVTLTFILVIVSFNIFFSLSMLVLEKKEDLHTLRAMGAWNGLLRQIFLYEGALIAILGAAFGLLLGYGLCFLQAQYGLVKMGTVSLLVDAYPVKTELGDFLGAALVVVLITLGASWLPAQRAAAIR
jgi:lipoprotein-releasing system permease protein